MDFETWLKEEDMQRLWDVCQGNLPEAAASERELEEFHRCVMHAAMVKIAGADYLSHTVQ
jgi:hypothetical protein